MSQMVAAHGAIPHPLATLIFGLAVCPWVVDSQGMSPPKWLSDQGKDLFNDLESDEHVFGDAACEAREKLLKHLAGHSERDAIEHRHRVLMSLGICEFKKGDYDKSKKRLESAISEMQAPSEDALLQNVQTASIVLMKQASAFLVKHEISQAGTALRRCREIIERNLKKVMKYIQKQMGENAPPLDKLTEEIPVWKTGQFLPHLVKQAPILKQDLNWMDQVDEGLATLDKKLLDLSPGQKSTKERLDVSKGKSKDGSLLYVKVLPTDTTAEWNRLRAAEELKSKVAKPLKADAESIEKSTTLIKRTAKGSGCKDKLEKTCESLLKIADVASNPFGDTRVLVVKAGKKQQLDMCTTNANVGILMAIADGATVVVGNAKVGQLDPMPLKSGEPLVVDFCQEGYIEATAEKPVHVLFAQAWHPEFAAVERTSEIRARSKTFGLSEDDIKAVTKIVNDDAKKNWDKTAKAWRQDSQLLDSIKQSLLNEVEAAKRAEEVAAEAKRKEDEDNDEERKKNLEALKKKREEKAKAEEEAEKKKEARRKQLELERANRDPWLLAPEVQAAEKNLEELKEARRDANVKLEFDLSTQLTKDISAAERALKKAIKQAKKAHKKGAGGTKSDTASSEGKGETEKSAEKDIAKLKKKLEEVKKEKAKASEAEDYAKAKKLKAQQLELEEQIKKKQEL